MAERRRVADARQAAPVALGRIFALQPAGGLTAAQLDPLRAALIACRVSLDALRFAAEDAVALDPILTIEAERRDVILHGAALAEQLVAAQDELDLLAHQLREQVTRAS